MRSVVDRALSLLEPCAGGALSDPRPVVGRGPPAYPDLPPQPRRTLPDEARQRDRFEPSSTIKDNHLERNTS